MGPALTLAADEVQCPQTQWSPYKAKLLPPTHPRKVTLVTLGHMCGPTHPQVTKVTLFHVKRSQSEMIENGNGLKWENAGNLVE